MLYNTRSNAVLGEEGDPFRDTVALTVRADGSCLPPYFITHTYKNAARDTGRRCEQDQVPVKGMNVDRMKEYIDFICYHIHEHSLFVMDQLSSHCALAVTNYIQSKLTANGQQLLIPILLPPKTSFLVSPLDMGVISAFKAHFKKLDRATLHLKKKAVCAALNEVSQESIANIWQNCGITGDESFESIRGRFLKELGGLVPEGHEDYLEFFDMWESRAINVEGVHRGRGEILQTPQYLPGTQPTGRRWTRFGGKITR
jgi:hypothetical protein